LAGGDAFSDAIKSSIQEHLMSSHSASTLEVVRLELLIAAHGTDRHRRCPLGPNQALFSNLSGCLCAIPILIFTGELAAVYQDFSLRAHIALIVRRLVSPTTTNVLAPSYSPSLSLSCARPCTSSATSRPCPSSTCSS
jgi:hypothetical protein